MQISLLDPRVTILAGALALCLIIIFIYRWLSEPARLYARQQRIAALWRQRGILLSWAETLHPGDRLGNIVRDLIEDNKQELRDLGVPADVLEMIVDDDIVGWMCICGHWQEDDFHCSACGAEPPWGCDCSMHDEPYDLGDLDCWDPQFIDEV